MTKRKYKKTRLSLFLRHWRPMTTFAAKIIKNRRKKNRKEKKRKKKVD